MIFKTPDLWRIVLFVSLLKFLTACSTDSKKIGVCLHTYLERDFPSIEMIVYPKYGKSRETTLLLEGPKLETDCRHLQEVLECFVKLLKGCEYMEKFFEYRRLIVSLEETLHWLCGDIQLMRIRFVVLLRKLSCIEDVWNNKCHQKDIKPNVWNRILRLEEDSSICGPLVEQQKCLVDSREIYDRCEKDAHYVYSNMSQIFLTSWCSSSHVEKSSRLISTFIPVLFMCVMWIKQFFLIGL